MKTINGIVCVAVYSDLPKRYILFGKNCGGTGLYQNFESNNLTPFGEVGEARQAFEQLLRRKSDIQPTGLCQITLKLADDLREAEKLKNEKALIAIESVVDINNGKPKWEAVLLYGRRVKGCAGFDSRAELCANGFKPYRDEKIKYLYPRPRMRTNTAYEQAVHAAREIIRQDLCFATISTFKLRKIKF